MIYSLEAIKTEEALFRMKVLHLNFSNKNGGAAKAAYRIHEALKEKGVNSIFIGDEINSENNSDITNLNFFDKMRRKLTIKIFNLFKIILGGKYKNNTNFGLIGSPWLKRINEIKPDIVHLHWPGKEILSIKQIGEINAVTVWTMHDLWAILGTSHIPESNFFHEKKTSGIRIFLGKRIDNLVLNLKKKYWKKKFVIVTPSNWMKNQFKKNAIFKNFNIIKIPHPINLEVWKPLDKSACRDELSIAQEEKIILFGAYEGIKDLNKGFVHLENSLQYLTATKESKYRLIVFGSKESLPSHINNVPITSFGYIDNNQLLNKLYSSADVFAMPSDYESFGQTALEAICSGTPVVAFSNNGSEEVIKHNKNGYIVDRHNKDIAAEFARGLRWSIRNTNVLDKDENSKIIMEFNSRSIATSYINLYHQSIKKIHI